MHRGIKYIEKQQKKLKGVFSIYILHNQTIIPYTYLLQVARERRQRLW